MSAFEISFSENSQTHEEHVSSGQIIIGMVGVIALLAMLNIFLDRIGILITTSAPSTFVPVLGPGFYALLPWWNLYLILAFSFGSVLLLLRRWYPPLRWINSGLTAYVIGLLVVTVFDPTIIGLAPEWLAEHNLPEKSLAALEGTVFPLISILMRLGMVGALLAAVGRTAKKLSEAGSGFCIQFPVRRKEG